VDAVKRTLSRDGRVIPITAKAFDVLLVLLDSRDRVLEKDELLSRVWPSTVVHENNLARQISSLRRALGQRPDQHDYIITIPGQGYRFVAGVEDLPDSDRHASEAVDSDAPPIPSRPVYSDDTLAATPADLGPAPDTVPAERTRSRMLTSAALLTACGLLALTGVMLVVRSQERLPQAHRVLQRVTYDEAVLPRHATWSPDGLSLMYVSDRTGNADLWRQRVEDPDPERVTTSEANETEPAWSPDGRLVAFRSDRDGGGLYVMPATGGAERIVAPFGYEPRWSPDSRHILFKRSAVLPDLPTIYVVGIDGDPPRPVRPDILGEFRSVQAAWHPDGRRVSIWGTIGKTQRRFMTVPLGGDRPATSEIPERIQRILAELSPGRFLWAPSGRFIYFEGNVGDTRNTWRVAVDPATQNWTAGPDALTTGPGEETNIAISPDGKRLLLTRTSSRTRLWAFPLDLDGDRVTGAPFPITDGSTGEVDFDVRPDGSAIAYRAVRAGRNELWERSIGRGDERLLLSSSDSPLMKPRWSPDGARIAFSRCTVRYDGLAVAILSMDGSGERAVTRPGEVDMQAFDWSADGRGILGACRFRESDRYATCLASLSEAAGASGPVVRVLAADSTRNLFNQRFSPDQQWITFLAHDLAKASTSTVYVTPTRGGPWIPMTEGTWFDDKPRWSADGRTLYFVSNRSGVANVWGRRFDPSAGTPLGEPFPITSFRSPGFALTSRTVQMDIAVTRTHLMLPMSESRSEIWMLDDVDR
jgi:Tol biopolymer transport system component/DNA-binding winged helix-turn-helix (wHTH) protein